MKYDFLVTIDVPLEEISMSLKEHHLAFLDIVQNRNEPNIFLVSVFGEKDNIENFKKVNNGRNYGN